MKAMVLHRVSDLHSEKRPLALENWPVPAPRAKEIRIRVATCAVCRTDLDEIEGRTPLGKSPVVPGHQIVGRVDALGPGATRFNIGDRVGIAWIHSACGHCEFCRSGQENLCDEFKGTGRDADGGYAEWTTVHEDFAYPIPDIFTDVEAAPLLCAGAVGYRALRLTGLEDGQALGFMGFGGSGHLVLLAAKHAYPNSHLYVFTRSAGEQGFARGLGATWAGAIDAPCPEALASIIDTTPVWKVVVESMNNLAKGGRLVINAISKEELDKDYLLRLNYSKHLWMEKEIKTVANVTRLDVRDFLTLAAAIPIRPTVQEFPLEHANEALLELKTGKIRGAKVLRIGTAEKA